MNPIARADTQRARDLPAALDLHAASGTEAAQGPVAHGMVGAGDTYRDRGRDIAPVTAHLVPTDDTPGAREAHVVRFIDTALGTILADFREEFLKTLGAFDEFMSHYRPDGAPFLALSPNEQVDALGELERLAPETFGPIRSATMLGMFVHPEHGGNFRKVGWQLIGYVDQYSWAPPFGYYDRA